MGAIAIEERDGDDGYDRQRQRELDALIDAGNEGRMAGMLNLAAGLNPYTDPHSPEYREWERQRLATIGQAIGRAA